MVQVSNHVDWQVTSVSVLKTWRWLPLFNDDIESVQDIALCALHNRGRLQSKANGINHCPLRLHRADKTSPLKSYRMWQKLDERYDDWLLNPRAVHNRCCWRFSSQLDVIERCKKTFAWRKSQKIIGKINLTESIPTFQEFWTINGSFPSILKVKCINFIGYFSDRIGSYRENHLQTKEKNTKWAYRKCNFVTFGAGQMSEGLKWSHLQWLSLNSMMVW